MSTVFRSIAFPDQVVSGTGAYVVPVGFDARVHIRCYKGKSFSINGVKQYFDIQSNFITSVTASNGIPEVVNNTDTSAAVDWVRSGGTSHNSGIYALYGVDPNFNGSNAPFIQIGIYHRGNAYTFGALLNNPAPANQTDVEVPRQSYFYTAMNAGTNTATHRICFGPDSLHELHLQQGTVIDEGSWIVELYANGKTE